MADRAPGGAQAVVKLVHRQHQAGPGRVLALLFKDLGNGFSVIGQDLLDRRQHVFGTDRREGRQIVGLQKRVVRTHGLDTLAGGNTGPS